MNQRLTDDFYILNRFRDVLTRATASCDKVGLVLDVPATVRRMAAMHDQRISVSTFASCDFLTVRMGDEAHFTVQMTVSGAPVVGLVRGTIAA